VESQQAFEVLYIEMFLFAAEYGFGGVKKVIQCWGKYEVLRIVTNLKEYFFDFFLLPGSAWGRRFGGSASPSLRLGRQSLWISVPGYAGEPGNA
jgi:hypothetical protein